jgi:hypothetical protein
LNSQEGRRALNMLPYKLENRYGTILLFPENNLVTRGHFNNKDKFYGKITGKKMNIYREWTKTGPGTRYRISERTGLQFRLELANPVIFFF